MEYYLSFSEKCLLFSRSLLVFFFLLNLFCIDDISTEPIVVRAVLTKNSAQRRSVSGEKKKRAQNVCNYPFLFGGQRYRVAFFSRCPVPDIA